MDKICTQLKSKIVDSQIVIDISNLIPGVYYLSLSNGEEMIGERFVKQ